MVENELPVVHRRAQRNIYGRKPAHCDYVEIWQFGPPFAAAELDCPISGRFWSIRFACESMQTCPSEIANMLIHDMSRQASITLLARTRLCRLACAHEGQPYVTPISCAYSDNCLYSFSRLGQKITWMRANPLVCVEADEVASLQDWATVVVLGKYEELPKTPKYEMHRKRAYDLLQMRPVWWEPAYVRTVNHEKARPTEFMYFRIHIDQISGQRGVPDIAPDQEFSALHDGPVGWMRKILRRPEHPKSGR